MNDANMPNIELNDPPAQDAPPISAQEDDESIEIVTVVKTCAYDPMTRL